MARTWTNMTPHGSLINEEFDEYEEHKLSCGMRDTLEIRMHRRASAVREATNEEDEKVYEFSLGPQDIAEIVRILVNRRWLAVQVSFGEGEVYSRRSQWQAEPKVRELRSIEAVPNTSAFCDWAHSTEGWGLDDMNSLVLKCSQHTETEPHCGEGEAFALVPYKEKTTKKKAAKKGGKK